MWASLSKETLTSPRYHMGSNAWNVTAIHRFICAIYGHKKKTIHKVRIDLFYLKQPNQNKIVDMPTLSTREKIFTFHVKRANYIASILNKKNVVKHF